MKSVRNSTNFQTELNYDLKNLSKNDKEFLQHHQKVIKEYLTTRHQVDKHTGILLYHEMGFGKTISTISTLFALDTRKTIALMTKNLQANFHKGIDFYKTATNQEKDLNYDFVTINSSNMYKKIIEVSGGDLNGYNIVIDEAHDFFNSITNESTTQNALRLYKLIMQAKDIIVIFLTGQVIVNDPFELVPCFNMLNGYLYRNKVRETLFPEEYLEFTKYFVKDNNLIHKEKFQDRITGLVSYYGTKTLNKVSKGGIIKRKYFPDQLPLVVEKVEMSPYQFSVYDVERNKEKRDNKYSIATYKAMMKPKSVGVSYKPGSRQASNFTFPNNLLKTKERLKLTKEELTKNLGKYSNKYKKLIDNLQKNPKKLKLVYSFYVENGIKLIAQILKENGWDEYKPVIGGSHTRDIDSLSDINVVDEESYWVNSIIDGGNEFTLKNNNSLRKGGSEKKNKKGVNEKKELKNKKDKSSLTYALYLAEDPPEVRKDILSTFNSPQNKHGDLINVIFISKAAAQGTDLKRIREIHITEPYWNYGLIEQIIARGVRFKSHEDLPVSERNLTPYIYLSVYKSLETTDIELWEKSLKKHHVNGEFLQALIESSIECSLFNINDNVKCRSCIPNNKPLYYGDFYTDIKTNTRCEPIAEETIEAEEIIIDKVKYYFIKEPIQIFKYDKILDSYAELSKYTDEYDKVKEIISKKYKL